MCIRDSSYTDIADLAARVLSDMPQAVPLLKRGLDPASKKKDMVRRIDIIQAAAGACENTLYLRLAEEGSTVIQEAAVRALRHDPANIPLLIEYAGKAKSGVRSAALEALSQMRGGQVDAFWLDRLTAADVSADTLDRVYETDSDLVSDAVADLLVRLAKTADAPAAQDAPPGPQDDEAYVHNLLRAIVHKTSPKPVSYTHLDVYKRQQIQRAAGYLVAHALVHWQGFTGHDRLIDGGLPKGNHSVYRNALAGKHPKQISYPDLLRWNNRFLPIVQYSRCLGREMHQLFNPRPGFCHCQLLQQSA